MVSATMRADKSLIYHEMPLMNPRTIVIIILPTIMLMEDQKKEFKQRNVSALVVIAAAIKANPNI